MKSFRDRVAVITGAGSGIGRALALDLSRRGAKLSLSDIDADALADTARLCSGNGTDVQHRIVDVTHYDHMCAYAEAVAAHFGGADLLFNNAGIIFTGGLQESTPADMHRVLDVDFWGVVHGTKAFLPHLIRSPSGHLINLSSAYGLMGAPSYSAYCAAKFAVRGFTEAVQQEMRAVNCRAKVSCVFPGAVRTSILRTSTYAAGQDHAAINRVFDKMARTSPEQASAVILRGVQAGKSRIMIGPDAHGVDVVTRIAATGYQRVFRVVSRRNQAAV